MNPHITHICPFPVEPLAHNQHNAISCHINSRKRLGLAPSMDMWATCRTQLLLVLLQFWSDGSLGLSEYGRGLLYFLRSYE